MLELSAASYTAMLAHALDGLPNEACGLMVGSLDPARVLSFAPTENQARSAKLYTVPPRDHLRIDREAEDSGHNVVGVMHSHTHSEAYPSPTDVQQAPDPGWHYVIVSLRHPEPVLRSYRIVDGGIREEPVVVLPE